MTVLRRSSLVWFAFALTALIALGACRKSADTRRVSLIVTGGTVVTVDSVHRVLSPGAVAVDGNRIAGVGRPDEIAAQFSAPDTIEATGDVILPGLINTHTHAAMVMYRGLADDLALMDWLQQYIFPGEAKTVSPEMVRIGTRLAALEMIQSGTTTFADMYYFEEEVAKATKAAGLRGVLGQTIIGFPVADARTPAEALARTEAFIKAFAGDELITPVPAPHSTYTVDEATLRAVREVAARYQVPILIHLAETEDEVSIIGRKYHLSPTAWLDSIGFLAPNVVAAHCVWLNDEDIAIMKRRGASVSHNPESNMKLASGVAPVTKYLAAGVTVGLGTDGAASNNDLDMFEAMRQAAFLHKLASKDPTAVPATAALDMATIGGARALGLDGKIGSLEVGKRADLIVVSMRGARQTPMYNAPSHLVYVSKGGDVRTTIVNGRILMRDRRVLTLDDAVVLADARKLAVKVQDAVRKH
ncbi:MAG TPA: amidohydrolase [Vicinamibacterales bacterium]|jgi:5-methylthioadenosine/S-adenosylhomocysteine deaminase